MGKFILAISFSAALAAVLSGCGTEASCAVCRSSFTTEQCQSIAVASGCTRGESFQDTVCSPPTQGCRFYGCTGGRPMCMIESDSGADASAAD